MKKALFKHGFTLIELILVTTILAVIGLALYGTFANGIHIWKRVTQESTEEDISLFLEKISYDLRNGFKITGIKFRGGNNKVSFPAKMKMNSDEGTSNSIGQVTYYFDRGKKTLNKRVATYSDVYKNKPGSKQVLTGNISSLQFQYFIYDQNSKKYLWVTSWQEVDEPFGIPVEDNLPLVVRIEVGVPKEHGEQKFVKTVQIPSACCWPFMSEPE